MFNPASPEYKAIQSITLQDVLSSSITVEKAPPPAYRPEAPKQELLSPDGGLPERYRELGKILHTSLWTPDFAFRLMAASNPIGDDLRIHPVPLILPRHEIQRIRHSTAQTARALGAFFEDLVLGKGDILVSGLVPPGIVDTILRGSRFRSLSGLRSVWEERTARDITFSIRPDFIRSEAADFRVMEVNVGPLGGRADNRAIHQWFSAQFSHHRVRSAESRGFVLQSTPWSELVSSFITSRAAHQRIVADLCSDDVLWNPSLGPNKDDEGYRIAKELTKLTDMFCPPELLAMRKAFGSKVTYLDRGFGSTTLDNLFAAGKIDPLNAPGTTPLLDSKLLLPYLETIIEFYLRESPSIRTIESHNVILHESEDEPFVRFEIAHERPQRYLDVPRFAGLVVKAADACAGQGVWLIDEANEPGASIFLQIFSQLQKLVDAPKEPLVLCVQKLHSPSLLDSASVDICPIALYLGSGDCVVDELPWGRARDPQVQLMPNVCDILDVYRFAEKTNVSCGASELVIVGAPADLS